MIGLRRDVRGFNLKNYWHVLKTYIESRSLRFKLASVALTLLVIAFLLGLEGILSQSQMRRDMENAVETELLGVIHAKDIQIEFMVMGRAMRQAVETENPRARAMAFAEVGNARANIERLSSELRERLMREQNQLKLDEFEATYGEFDQQVRKIEALMAEGREAQASRLAFDRGLVEEWDRGRRLLFDIAQSKQEGALAKISQVRLQADQSQNRSIQLLLFGMLLGAGIAMLIASSIRR
ncbi:MAG TPA: hypothetical protein DCF63_06355, partial [Planctomycetaceae bacterium]|nr:hypothetical protein [Planctomycetaceae bacterium]